MDLYDAFECAFYMYACMAQVLDLKLHACASHPIFQRRPSTHYLCAQEVHTYNNRIETSK
jgi:hypothetical protein